MPVLGCQSRCYFYFNLNFNFKLTFNFNSNFTSNHGSWFNSFLFSFATVRSNLDATSLFWLTDWLKRFSTFRLLFVKLNGLKGINVSPSISTVLESMLCGYWYVHPSWIFIPAVSIRSVKYRVHVGHTNIPRWSLLYSQRLALCYSHLQVNCSTPVRTYIW